MSKSSLTIAFDADDTLWHNEPVFQLAHHRFRQLLEHLHPHEEINRRLYQTEIRNIHLYGYGIKGFTLSAIETALQLTAPATNNNTGTSTNVGQAFLPVPLTASTPSESKVSSNKLHSSSSPETKASSIGLQSSSADAPTRTLIQSILAIARDMLDHPVQLLDNAKETIAALARNHTLILITKGDLLDQHRKLRQSALAPHFDHIEITTEKTPDDYLRILHRHNIAPENFLMVGNSTKSDILAPLSIGASAVLIPYPIVWEHEKSPLPLDNPRFHQLPNLSHLPALVQSLQQ